MKKKLISIMLASALVASCLTGCGNSGDGAASGDSGAAESSDDAEGGVRQKVLVLRSQ